MKSQNQTCGKNASGKVPITAWAGPTNALSSTLTSEVICHITSRIETCLFLYQQCLKDKTLEPGSSQDCVSKSKVTFCANLSLVLWPELSTPPQPRGLVPIDFQQFTQQWTLNVENDTKLKLECPKFQSSKSSSSSQRPQMVSVRCKQVSHRRPKRIPKDSSLRPPRPFPSLPESC